MQHMNMYDYVCSQMSRPSRPSVESTNPSPKSIQADASRYAHDTEGEILDLSLKKSGDQQRAASCTHAEASSRCTTFISDTAQPVQDEPIDFSTKCRQRRLSTEKAAIKRDYTPVERLHSGSWHVPASSFNHVISDVTSAHGRHAICQPNVSSASSANMSSHNSNHAVSSDRASHDMSREHSGDNRDDRSSDHGSSEDLNGKISVKEAAAVLMDMSLSLATPPTTPIMTPDAFHCPRYG